MKKILIFTIIILVFLISSVSGQDMFKKGKANYRKGLRPEKVILNNLPFPSLREEFSDILMNKEYGPEKSYTIYDELRLKAIVPNKPVQVMTKEADADMNFEAPILFSKFSELKRYNLRFEPGDPSIAVGRNHTLLLTNDGFYIYNKASNDLLYHNTLTNFFDTDFFIFDPIVKYDDISERWIFTVVAKNDDKSNVYLAVSTTDNPLDDWYYYLTSGLFDGNRKSVNWADRPYLGVTSVSGENEKGAVVISMNQYNFSSFRPSFQYSKIRIFDKRIIYSGGEISSYWDFWDFEPINYDVVFNVAVANHLTPTANGDVYLFNTISGGGSRVYLWKIENPLADTPSFKRINSINVSDYSIPPKSPVYGQTDSLNIFDCRVLSVVYMNDNLYAGYNSGYNWGKGNNCVFKILRINTESGRLIYEKGFGAEGSWYMYPAIMPLFREPVRGDTIAVGFICSSSEILPEARIVYFNGKNTWSQSTLIMTGNKSSETMFRLGDYNTLAADPYIKGNFWAAIGISSSDLWGVAIGHFGFFPRE